MIQHPSKWLGGFVIIWALLATYSLINMERFFIIKSNIYLYLKGTPEKIIPNDIARSCYVLLEYNRMTYEKISKIANQEYIDCIYEKIFFFADFIIPLNSQQEFRDRIDKLIHRLYEVCENLYCGQWEYCGSGVTGYCRVVKGKVLEVLLGVVVEAYNYLDETSIKRHKEEWHTTHPEWQSDRKAMPSDQNDSDDKE